MSSWCEGCWKAGGEGVRGGRERMWRDRAWTGDGMWAVDLLWHEGFRMGLTFAKGTGRMVVSGLCHGSVWADMTVFGYDYLGRFECE